MLTTRGMKLSGGTVKFQPLLPSASVEFAPAYQVLDGVAVELEIDR
jgi:hypothetical protein